MSVSPNLGLDQGIQHTHAIITSGVLHPLPEQYRNKRKLSDPATIRPQKIPKFNAAEVSNGSLVSPVEEFQSIDLREQLNTITRVMLEGNLEMANHLIIEFNALYSHTTELVDRKECGHNALITQLLSHLANNNLFIPTDLKLNSVKIIGLLARSDAARKIIIKEDGFRILLQRLIADTESPTFLRNYCFAIGNTVVGIKEESLPTIALLISNLSIIPLLLSMLVKYQKDAEIVREIFFALGNICYTGNFETIIIFHSGIDCTFSVLFQHLDNPLVLSDGLFFLKNLCFTEEGRSAIFSHSSLSTLLDILPRHIENSELVEIFFTLLVDLSSSDPVEELFNSTSRVKFVMNSLILYRHEIEIVKQVVRLLYHLWIQTEIDTKVQFLKQGLIAELSKCFPSTLTCSRTSPLSYSSLRSNLESLITFISHDTVHYKKTPSSLPSLLQLSAREACQIYSIHIPDCLPDDLKYYLTTGRKCSHCGSLFFDDGFELLSQGYNEHFETFLPVFGITCSHSCYLAFQNAGTNKIT